MNFSDPRLPDSFWSKCTPEPNTGCWLWIAGTTGRTDYARIRHNKSKALAHRVSYMVLRGPVPEGLKLDHLCRTTLCVNPLHLEAVTQQENVRRGISPPARAAAKTHCKRGHELSGDNLRIFERKPGRFMRTCLACERALGIHRTQSGVWRKAV